MQTIWALYRLQIDEKIDLFKKRKTWLWILSLLKILAIIAVAIVVVWFVFLRFHTIGLGINQNLFAILLMVTQLISFALALGSIFNTLYFNKDNDLLMSMPCSHNQVFISKLMVLYTFEFLANTLYTLPIYVGFAILSQISVSVFFYIYIPVALILLPLLSLSIAAFVSVPLMMIYNLLKKNSKVLVITMLLVVLALFGTYMLLVNKIASSINFSGQQATIMFKINDLFYDLSRKTWIFKVLSDAFLFLNGWWWKHLVFYGFCIFFAAISILMVRGFYFNLAMKNSETSIVESKKQGKYKYEKPLISFMKTEYRSIFRSPGYVFQYFLFTILMPFIVFAYDKLLTSVTVNQTGQAMISASHLLVLAILATLSNLATSTSVSREGGNFYLTKVTPVSFKDQALAKIIFNCVFTIGMLLITMIVSIIFTKIFVWHAVISTAAVAVVSVGHIVLNYLIDLNKPVLDWFDASEIDKISKNTRISMIIGLLISFLMFGCVFMFASTSHIFWPWIILIVGSCIFTFVVLMVYHFKVKKMHERTEA